MNEQDNVMGVGGSFLFIIKLKVWLIEDPSARNMAKK